MIARMSKLEIAGPKERLLEVLEVIRELGVFQPDPDAGYFVAAERQGDIHLLIPDQGAMAERLFLENLRRLTSRIIELLPAVETRASLLDPLPLLDSIASVAERHLALCRDLDEQRTARLSEINELDRCAALLGAIETLVGDLEPHGNLEFIGVTLRDSQQVERLREGLSRLTGGDFTLSTSVAADGALIGLITTPAAGSRRIRQALNEEQFPELPFPPALRDLPFPKRIRLARERIAAADRELAELDLRREIFARRWLPYYRRIDQWLAERLALFSTSSVVHETGMCFVILGWAPSDATAGLARQLNGRFRGEVAVEELQLLEQDLDRVPVALRNPPYLRPFELFTRLLPLPRYSSWDPTPFIGIFFPIFFGMMLGDAGHGLVLVIVALLVMRRRRSGMLADAARILLVSAGFAVLFGILFGEFFGEAGGHMLPITPLLPERSSAIMPLLMFSIALGVSHVLLGLLIGLITALQRHERREAAGRIVTICLLLCLAALAASLIAPSPWLRSTPFLVAAGILIPFLFLSGGLLAPLELVKQIGNIVSYARIMAIGLSSALLANIANHLAGLSGDVVLGAMAAIVLHAVAIVLGTFAPAIQALRLHFVEFFSKFVEPGGRRFEPLHK